MFSQAFTCLTIAVICGQSKSEPIDILDSVDFEFPGSGRWSFTRLANKYGYKAEEHEVITEDGYILTLFHIKGRSPPVLLVHGILDSSDTWLLRGENSLGITLANSGYDVWFGNTRGNIYSRRHVTLNPDVDTKFWEFSFNEIGYYDYPAILDKILNQTSATSITAIAHSQGTTAFYVLGSSRSEYNSKINILISLAPVCYIHHAPTPFSTFIKIRHALKEFFLAFQIHEVLGDKSQITKILRFICTQPIIGYKVCAIGLISVFTGFDLEELEPSFYKKVTKYIPSGTSAQSLLHYLQVGHTKIFAPYDYGDRNQFIYNSSVPPPYDLSKVTFPNALLAARNDHISTLADVALLREQLPNVVYYLVNPRQQFNHVDDIWGRRMYLYLFPYIFRLLRTYNGF